LEGYGSTIELHPQSNDENQMTNVEEPFRHAAVIRHLSFVLRHYFQWRVKDSNLRRHCHQIYSLTPLATRETLRLRSPARDLLLAISCSRSLFPALFFPLSFSLWGIASAKPVFEFGIDKLIPPVPPTGIPQDLFTQFLLGAAQPVNTAPPIPYELAEGLEPTTCGLQNRCSAG
jgi:hypothetical protein